MAVNSSIQATSSCAVKTLIPREQEGLYSQINRGCLEDMRARIGRGISAFDLDRVPHLSRNELSRCGPDSWRQRAPATCFQEATAFFKAQGLVATETNGDTIFDPIAWNLYLLEHSPPLSELFEKAFLAESIPFLVEL